MNNDFPEDFPPGPSSKEDALDYARYFLATFVHLLYELGLESDKYMHILGHAYVDSLMIIWGYENLEGHTCGMVIEVISTYACHRKLRDSIFNSPKKDIVSEYLEREGFKRHAES